jgi:acyl carrier protein
VVNYGTDATSDGDISRRLASVFASVLGVDQESVQPELGPNDVERWDSLGHLMLIGAIQEVFAIQFDVDEIMEFTSFQAILSALERSLTGTPRETSAEGKGSQ